MAKSTKIPITLPAEYMEVDNTYPTDYVFKYLKDIGFYRYEFIDLVNWSTENQKIFEYHVNQLSENPNEIPVDTFLGALYMVYKNIPELLTYESFCKIAVEKRGGFSISYKKKERVNSEVMQYREEVREWIQEVLDEPYEKMDSEVRQAEYSMHAKRIDQLQKSTAITSSEYTTFLRPGSEIQQLLKTRVRHKLWPDEND